jgi:hypothetical protein
VKGERGGRRARIERVACGNDGTRVNALNTLEQELKGARELPLRRVLRLWGRWDSTASSDWERSALLHMRGHRTMRVGRQGVTSGCDMGNGSWDGYAVDLRRPEPSHASAYMCTSHLQTLGVVHIEL